MAKDHFRFKQFTVWHDRCAMKVGTDGVLLGAWAPVEGVKRVLDVGTGSGVIALQIAQRAPHARIIAVEIDPEAARQAASNVAASPWADRIQVVCADFAHFLAEEPFDLIVSNPPYFVHSLHNPDASRTQARHNDSLPYDILFRHATTMLAPEGTFCLIAPTSLHLDMMGAAFDNHLGMECINHIFTKPGICKRAIYSFTRKPPTGMLPMHQVESLSIHDDEGNYTEEYRQLTAPFYLHF